MGVAELTSLLADQATVDCLWLSRNHLWPLVIARNSPEMSMGPLQLPMLFSRFKGPNRKEVIGNLPDVNAGPWLALALTMRLSVVIVNHNQGDSTTEAPTTQGSQNNPETPSDAPMADAAKSHTSATLLCSFYRSRYLFLPFSNGRGVRLAI